jgi:hypothetical protein
MDGMYKRRGRICVKQHTVDPVANAKILLRYFRCRSDARLSTARSSNDCTRRTTGASSASALRVSRSSSWASAPSN